MGCGGSESPTNGGHTSERPLAPPNATAATKGQDEHRAPRTDSFVPAAVEAGKSEPQELTTENTKIYPNEEYQASIVQMLAHRDRYHGKEVQIKGYLRVEFEGTAIYLSKEDADYHMTGNGFWVNLSESSAKYDRKYVLIEGTFDKDSMGHHSSWQGTITDVTRVYELTRHE